MSDPRRADALHRDGHYASAVEAYRSALAADPLLLDAWYGLGCAHRSLQAYGAAASALRRAVELRPDANGARCSLAEVLFQLGEVDAAMAEFRSLTAIDDPEIRALALANIACIAPGSTNCDNADILAAQAKLGRFRRRRAEGRAARHRTRQTADRLSERLLWRA